MNLTGRTPPQAAPVLELDNVTLELGERVILRDTSLQVNEGEFIGVLGPNGGQNHLDASRARPRAGG
jgi:zinc/manganese transport system ATP-binding protein